METKNIILSINRALLGAICNKIRAISFDYTSDKFKLFVYTETQLTPDEYEAISIASTEVLADFPQFTKEEIHIIISNDDFKNLNSYKSWVFMRME